MRAALTIPPQPRTSAAQVMFDTAVELEAHEHAHEAAALFRRAAEASRDAPTSPRDADVARVLGAAATGLAGDWTGADSMFRALSAARPGDIRLLGWTGLAAAHTGDHARAERVAAELARVEEPYPTGLPSLFRACIAGTLGRQADAVTLLRRALAEGFATGALHGQSCLLPLRGYAPYEALAHPVR